MRGKKTGGRKPGSANRLTKTLKALTEKTTVSGLTTPLELMLEVMRDSSMALAVRLDAAAKAAPFVHPKLASIEHMATVAVQPLAPPMAPREVVSAVKQLLTEAERAMDVKRIAGSSDAERLRAIVDSGSPLPPQLFAVLSGDEEK